MIRAGRRGELTRIQAIERSAGDAFVDLAMPEIAQDEPLSVEALSAYLAAQRLWVATDKTDLPVAYIIVEVVDDCAHVEQVSVDAQYAGRRLGKALIDRVGDWAIEQGLAALTLTTFRDVPWNAPYYERCGFRVLGDDELGLGLAAVRTEERHRGLDRWPRVAMRRELVVGMSIEEQ